MEQSQANNSSDFVRKLYKMLETPQDETVVRWGNEGDSFVVLENEKFTKHILPKHFKHSNFASFVRQLNKYDFHKVRHNNEEGGTSPYGSGAWEFKHPDFKMNNKDALDNIRRKAPAPRKSGALGGDELLLPTQQVDMLNTQLMATQQQVHQLQERYNELSMHHSMLLQELIGVQKTVINHEHVMQYVMNFLNSVDAQRRRESRALGNPFAQQQQQQQQQQQSTNGAAAAATTTTTTTAAGFDEDVPASPLQHASKLLSDVNAENVLNSNKLEQMSEQHHRMNAANFSTPPPANGGGGGTRSSSRGAPTHTAMSSAGSYADLDSMVYPIGTSTGIDPMYSEHIHNIPYSVPPKAADVGVTKKKAPHTDPGWMRQPQILLVEDDQTCRRIGGKFLYAFNCAIDSALDGMEAVDKLNKGAKYDLVLMDIIMPNLDGVSATHLIRQYDNHTPIIAMTSNIRSDDIAMYFQHGMNDVLPKPFTKEGLLNMLEKHLAHLKKPTAGLEMGGIGASPSQIIPQKRSLKGEDSPTTSPAGGSSWNSPTGLAGAGVTPEINHDDPYMHAVHNNAAGSSFNLQAPGGFPPNQRGGPIGLPPGPHGRQR